MDLPLIIILISCYFILLALSIAITIDMNGFLSLGNLILCLLFCWTIPIIIVIALICAAYVELNDIVVYKKRGRR